jgi:hypothetical protein
MKLLTIVILFVLSFSSVYAQGDRDSYLILAHSYKSVAFVPNRASISMDWGHTSNLQVEPIVDFSSSVKLAEQLYVLGEQLRKNAEQVHLATCGNGGPACDLHEVYLTQLSLDEFNKGVQEFYKTLVVEFVLLEAKKQYRSNHGEEIESVIKDENTVKGLQYEVRDKDETMVSWVQNKLIRGCQCNPRSIQP